MPGPIIEAAREVLGIEDEDTVRERIADGTVLAEHQEEMNERLRGNGGGCCNATMAAKASRRNGEEYR